MADTVAGVNRRRPLPFLAVLALTAACGGTYVAPPPTAAPSQPDPGRATAALTGFTDALGGRPVASLSVAETTAVANARAIGITDVSARYIDATGPAAPDGSWPGAIILSWHVRGEAPAEEEIGATFAPAGDATRVAGFGAPGTPVPLWLLDKVTVARSGGVTVIAAGKDPAVYLTLATTAVAQVRASIPWPSGRLTVEVPPDESTLEQVSGVASGADRGVAAYTGPVDGRTNGPVHIFINPDVIGSGRDAQIVMTHEATHAATNASTNTNLPAWLREGFADYVALRAENLPLSITADRVIASVRRSGAPAQLPSDADFNSMAEDFGEEYQYAWLACKMLGDGQGPARLYSFYEAVSAGTSVDTALRDVYGVGLTTFTEAWRGYLRQIADGSHTAG